MGGRLDGKIAIVVGAGQTPGDTIGNGRAISVLFGREGAKVMLVDRRLDSALETKATIERDGGEAMAFEATEFFELAPVLPTVAILLLLT